MADYDQGLVEQYRHAYNLTRLTVSERDAGMVREYHGRAEAYAWGRQDEALAVDLNQASNFANAYGIHCAEYIMGRVGTRVNLRGAWRRFVDGAPIGDL